MPSYWRVRHDQEDAADGCELIARVRSTERWQCDYCGRLQPASRTHCDECGHPRPDDDGMVIEP